MTLSNNKFYLHLIKPSRNPYGIIIALHVVIYTFFMNFSKWTNIIKVFLLRLIDELEMRLNEKQGIASSDSFKTSLYSSVKFLILEQVDDLAEEVSGYAKKQVHELANVISQKLSVVLASLVYVFIILALSIIAFLFLALSLSMYLGELLGKPYYGFLVTGMIFIVTTWIIWKWSRKSISEKINEFISSQL